MSAFGAVPPTGRHVFYSAARSPADAMPSASHRRPCAIVARLARSVARANGMPTTRQAFVPQPVVGRSPQDLRGYVDGEDPVNGGPFMQHVIEGLTNPLGDDDLKGMSFDRSLLYVMGRGVNHDEAEALKWYLRAAEQGESLAQFNVGMRYYEGHAVPPDQVEAYFWLNLAADQGVADAVKIRDGLKRTMTSEQLAQARRRAEAFAKRLPKTGTPGK